MSPYFNKVNDVMLLYDIKNEIIIVNDFSTDKSKTVLENYMKEHHEFNCLLSTIKK